MTFKSVYIIVLLRLIPLYENSGGFHVIKCRHLHVDQSSLAPLLVKADLPDIVSKFRLNSFSLKKMSQKDQMSMCRMQLRLAVRGPEGDEF